MRARIVVASSLFVRSLLHLPPSTVSFFAAAMSTTKSTIKNNVRIVSYNLLSSKLSRSSHFTRTDPEHLEFEYRLPLILEKLDDAMKRGSEGASQSMPPTIFALQEVCYPFASKLHAFFAQRGYHFVTGLYGRPFNGYVFDFVLVHPVRMSSLPFANTHILSHFCIDTIISCIPYRYMGVGIAYPIKDFDTLNVDICRLSDERSCGWPREKPSEEESGATGFRQKIVQKITAFAVHTMQSINNGLVKRLGYAQKEIDPWEISEKRFNVLLTVVLRFRTGDTFSVSNYHMPCAFWAPAVMNIHAEMAAKRVQDLAADSREGTGDTASSEGTKMIPYIFAGDFNILPDSPQYKLLTTGTLDKADPTYPPPKHGVEWKIQSVPMDSAYALISSDGSEPEFTNYAHIKDDPDPFIGTLDYIFLSKKEQTFSGDEWKVHGVEKLPGKEDSGGPFPNEKEPSDHFLIAADLELVSS